MTISEGIMTLAFAGAIAGCGAQAGMKAHDAEPPAHMESTPKAQEVGYPVRSDSKHGVLDRAFRDDLVSGRGSKETGAAKGPDPLDDYRWGETDAGAAESADPLDHYRWGCPLMKNWDGVTKESHVVFPQHGFDTNMIKAAVLVFVPTGEVYSLKDAHLTFEYYERRGRRGRYVEIPGCRDTVADKKETVTRGSSRGPVRTDMYYGQCDISGLNDYQKLHIRVMFVPGKCQDVPPAISVNELH